VSDLEAEKNTLTELKTKRELEVEDVLRQIKALEDEKSQVVHLKSMELSTMRGAHEQAMAGKQGTIKQLQAEIELLQEHIGKNQDAILSLQKTKLKDVASLKNQYQIMKDSLEHSKRKLQENAELMQVNNLFKKLKQHFDDLNGMIGDLHDLETLKRDYFQVKRDLGERELRGQTQEYRMRLGFARECEQQVLLYKKAMEDVEKEAVKVQAEISKIE
jgi:hypothetical protein